MSLEAATSRERSISHALQSVEKFLVSYSLLLSVQEDSERLEIKERDLQQADQRVKQGQKRIVAVYNSSASFFCRSKDYNKEKINDSEFVMPTQCTKH